ncbi:MAG: enoyl-CoA hydratase/isomerase family protein, partial [Pseudomonadota bacterium]
MSFRNLLVVNAGGVRTITVNRPDKLNALDRDTITELKLAIGAARDDDEVRAVVLTGAGPKAFVAGADITEFSDATPVQALAFSRHGQELMTAIERLGKPSIARINGFALGGGLELALACSLRIAAATAKLGLPEINLGILPGFGGTQRLLRLAGRAATLELALTGAPVTAARALEMGIINRVAALDNLDAEVGALAGQLAASAPHAVRGILDA